MNNSRWSWHGLVATILALSVAVGFAAAMIGATIQDQPITQQGAALLNTLGGALIGAVAGWLGGAAVERSQQREALTMTDQQQPADKPAVDDPATVPDATTPVQDDDAVVDQGDAPDPDDDVEDPDDVGDHA